MPELTRNLVIDVVDFSPRDSSRESSRSDAQLLNRDGNAVESTSGPGSKCLLVLLGFVLLPTVILAGCLVMTYRYWATPLRRVERYIHIIPTMTTTTATLTKTVTVTTTTNPGLAEFFAAEQHAAQLDPDPANSLFCFVVAEDYELPSVRWQAERQIGIFACDAFAVYSDKVTHPKLVGCFPDGECVYTTPIPGAAAWLGHLYGMKMVMNANVLLRAWKHVFNSSVAVKQNWTVKVDPDTVFLPHRLRKLLRRNGRPDVPDGDGGGRYMLNCPKWQSMQGPLEVLSRQATLALDDHLDFCSRSIGMNIGEDVFLDRCLRWYVHAWPLQNWESLKDSKCGMPSRWVPGVGLAANFDCTDIGTAAFHPFKDVELFRVCLRQAFEAEKLLSKEQDMFWDQDYEHEAEIAHKLAMIR